MNCNFSIVSAFGAGLMCAGLMTGAGRAQTPAVPAGGPTTVPAAQAVPAPQAVPAKIALVAFEQAVFATNEGQKTVQDLQKKFAPKKADLETLSNEIDALKKQLDGAPATLSADERTARLKAIDTKEKTLTRNGEDAQTAYNAELQDAYGKLAGRFSATLKDYVAKNGYTLLLDVSNQASAVMWATADVNTDVTQAAVEAYNASSGVAAPAPAAPSASRPAGAAPRTAPRPAAPK